MARRTITIDEKIDKAQAEVIKAKEKYEAAINELKELQEKKKEIQSKELMEAFQESSRSYDEIMAFLKSEG
jgi:hypothetical protein